MQYGKTRVVICRDESDLGRRAAADVAAELRRKLGQQEEVRMIMAAGQSQQAFLNALAVEGDIAWDRVSCFNMDDFWEPRMPQRFTCFDQTRTQLYDRVHPRRAERVRHDAPDPYAEARRFADLMGEEPFDILCQGIGTSGHLALNEPGQASFDTKERVVVVDVHEQSKRQLLADPHFAALGYIPDKGITMTLPALLSARAVFTMVPLSLKKPILTRVLATAAPTPDLPATILCDVPGTLYVDRDSCPDKVLQAGESAVL